MVFGGFIGWVQRWLGLASRMGQRREWVARAGPANPGAHWGGCVVGLAPRSPRASVAAARHPLLPSLQLPQRRHQQVLVDGAHRRRRVPRDQGAKLSWQRRWVAPWQLVRSHPFALPPRLAHQLGPSVPQATTVWMTRRARRCWTPPCGSEPSGGSAAGAGCVHVVSCRRACWPQHIAGRSLSTTHSRTIVCAGCPTTALPTAVPCLVHHAATTVSATPSSARQTSSELPPAAQPLLYLSVCLQQLPTMSGPSGLPGGMVDHWAPRPPPCLAGSSTLRRCSPASTG